jgi:hypothetical protein
MAKGLGGWEVVADREAYIVHMINIISIDST